MTLPTLEPSPTEPIVRRSLRVGKTSRRKVRSQVIWELPGPAFAPASVDPFAGPK